MPFLQLNQLKKPLASIMWRPKSFVSPRRPPLLAYNPPPEAGAEPRNLRAQLESLLEAIPRVIDKASDNVESTLSDLPGHVQHLFSEDGPLGALYFWRENRQKITDAGKTIRDSGEALVKGDADEFRSRASRLDLSWLRPRPSSLSTPPADGEFETRVRNVVLFMVESLTPWDFDRHDFGLTFANVWVDADALKTEHKNVVVKMTSTIKPVEREWKVTARTKLIELGEDAVVFGKAGLYLAGDQPAYIGVEADRVWKLPKLPDTKFFMNVNYRNSRKPQFDPVRTSLGLQQDFRIAKGLDLTLRLGINPLDRTDWYVTPVPNGSYF